VWPDRFFRETLKAFSTSGVLKTGGVIMLPNMQCVDEKIIDFTDIIDSNYHVSLLTDPSLNPLYRATDDVEDELMKCPDTLTNGNQIAPLKVYSDTPFYQLVCHEDTTAIVTPKKRKVSNSPPSTGRIINDSPTGKSKKVKSPIRKLVY
jgi:hypothetical protein